MAIIVAGIFYRFYRFSVEFKFEMSLIIAALFNRFLYIFEKYRCTFFLFEEISGLGCVY